jgi:hypothetical protein
MIPLGDLQAIEEALDNVHAPGVRFRCGRCGAELPGSDPMGTALRLGECLPACPGGIPAYASEKISNISRDLRQWILL